MIEAIIDGAGAGVDNRQRIILPSVLIDAIDAIAHGARSLGARDRINAVMILILGWAYYERQESIDPARFAIPAGQWEHICSILAGSADTDVGKVNIGLEFVSRGPGSYQDDTEQASQ